MKRIILDMDGVIVDWMRGIHKAMGWNYVPENETSWTFYKNHGVTIKDLEEKCSHGFWCRLPWMPDGVEIFNLLEALYGKENIYLVSHQLTPTNFGGTSGKQSWVLKEIGSDYINRLFVTTASKSIFACDKDCILVDDRPENCDEFIAAGGSAILVPAYHNKNRDWCNQRVDFIEERLKYGIK